MANIPTIQSSNLRLLSNANSVLDQVLALLKGFPGFPSIIQNLTVTGTLTAPVGGDLSGSLPNPTVAGIRNIPISTTAPTNNQTLVYNLSENKWVPSSSSSAPSGPAGGDLTGSDYPSPIISSLQGYTLTLPTYPSPGIPTNYVLAWNGLAWEPAAGGGPPSGSAGPPGDLGGSYPNPTVVGIQTVPVSSTAPTLHQVLEYVGGQWTPTTLTTSGPAGGDLTGSNYPNPTISKLQGNTVLASSPNAGDVLQWNETDWVNTPVPGSQGLPQSNLFSAGVYDSGQVNAWINVATISEIGSPVGITNPLITLQNGNVLIINGNTGACSLYNPTTGVITATGSMTATPSSSASLQAVLLNNGNVLAVGFTTANATQIYNTTGGTWSSTGNLPFNYSGPIGPSIIALADGTALFYTPVGGTILAAIYNPTGSTWTSVGSPTFSSLTGVNPVLLNTGNVLVIGPSGVADLYNPTTQTWSSTPGPSTTINFGAMVLLPNGNVLLAIGANFAQCKIYTTSSPNWINTGNLTQGGVNFSMAVVNSNTEVILVGIGTSSAIFDIYNISGGTWTSMANPPALPPAANTEYSFLTTLSNGSILGALGNQGGTETILSIFVPNVGNWVTTGGGITTSGTDTTTGYTLTNYIITTTTSSADFEFVSPGWGTGQAAGDYVFSCYIKTNAINSFGVNLNYNGNAGTTVQLTPTTGQYIRIWFPFTFPGNEIYQFGINFSSLPVSTLFSVGLFSITQGREPVPYTFPGNTSENISYLQTQYFGTSYPISSIETYKLGDITWNTTPSSSTIAWVCTTAGSPGTWTAIGSGGGGGGSVSGDLNGTVPGSITVIGIRGYQVTSTEAPPINYVLTGNGSTSSWQPTNITGITAGGDLTGTYTNPTIANLQGNEVLASGTITNGYALTWSTSAGPSGAWIPASVGSSSTPSGPATGDLTGSYPGPAINTIHITPTYNTTASLNLGPNGGTATVSPSLYFNSAVSSTAYQYSIQGIGGGTDLAINLPLTTSGMSVQLNSATTYNFTPTKLEIQNGVLGLYQEQGGNGLTLQGAASSGGNSIILNNNGAMSSGNLVVIQNNGTNNAYFSFNGNLSIAQNNSTNPTLTIGNASINGDYPAAIVFNSGGGSDPEPHTFTASITLDDQGDLNYDAGSGQHAFTAGDNNGLTGQACIVPDGIYTGVHYSSFGTTPTLTSSTPGNTAFTNVTISGTDVAGILTFTSAAGTPSITSGTVYSLAQINFGKTQTGNYIVILRDNSNRLSVSAASAIGMNDGIYSSSMTSSGWTLSYNSSTTNNITASQSYVINYWIIGY